MTYDDMMSAEPEVGGSSGPQTRSSGLFGVVSETVRYSLSNAFTSAVICEPSKYCFGKNSHFHCSEWVDLSEILEQNL